MEKTLTVVKTINTENKVSLSRPYPSTHKNARLLQLCLKKLGLSYRRIIQ